MSCNYSTFDFLRIIYLERRDIAKAYLSDYVQWATEEAKRYENVFVVGYIQEFCTRLLYFSTENMF